MFSNVYESECMFVFLTPGGFLEVRLRAVLLLIKIPVHNTFHQLLVYK